jgi:DNA-binding NtrC family response regulator
MAQVLVIDADEAIRATLGFLLEDDGHTVITTAGPEFALEHLRTSSTPMVVLFDAGAPRVSGGHVTALAMVDDPLLRRHAYICMTTSAALMLPDLHKALISLAVPILEKPFDLDALLALVGQAASRVAMQIHSFPQ